MFLFRFQSLFAASDDLILLLFPADPSSEVATMLNPYWNLFGNRIFWGVFAITIFMQVRRVAVYFSFGRSSELGLFSPWQALMIEFFGAFANTTSLSAGQWFSCIGIGALSIPWGAFTFPLPRWPFRALFKLRVAFLPSSVHSPSLLSAGPFSCRFCCPPHSCRSE